MLEEQLDRLIGKAICDDITTDEIEQLREVLSSSESARLKYVEAIDLYAAMFTLSVREPDKSQQLPVRWGRRKIGGRRARRFGWGLVATALFALIGFSTAVYIGESQTEQEGLVQSPNRANDAPGQLTPVVAWLSASSEVEWMDGLGDALTKDFIGWRVGDQIGINSGLAAVRLESGVQCCQSGESLFTIESPSRIHLAKGKAVFHVPKGAEGFIVTTPMGIIEDLGTTFGVSVAPAGLEVQVLKGRVVVTPKTTGVQSRPFQSRPFQVDANSTIRLDSNHGTVSAIPFDPFCHHDAIGFTAGVMRMSGQVQFHDSPNGSASVSELAPSTNAVLLREKTSEVLNDDLVYLDSQKQRKIRIPAGTVVDSFLLHFSSGEPSRCQCEIEFATDIVGVVSKIEDLDRTDAMFMQAPSLMDLNAFVAPTRGAESLGDVVLIDETHRILKLDLSCSGPASSGKSTLDQIRILVRTQDTP